jgi:hypothetical protein
MDFGKFEDRQKILTYAVLIMTAMLVIWMAWMMIERIQGYKDTTIVVRQKDKTSYRVPIEVPVEPCEDCENE